MDDAELLDVLERFGGFLSTRGINVDLLRGMGLSLEDRLEESDKLPSNVLRQLFSDWQEAPMTAEQFDVLNRVIGSRDESLDVAEEVTGLDLDLPRERVLPTGEPDTEFRWNVDRWSLFRGGLGTEVFSFREPVVRIQNNPDGSRDMIFINPDTGVEMTRRRIE